MYCRSPYIQSGAPASQIQVQSPFRRREELGGLYANTRLGQEHNKRGSRVFGREKPVSGLERTCSMPIRCARFFLLFAILTLSTCAEREPATSQNPRFVPQQPAENVQTPVQNQGSQSNGFETTHEDSTSSQSPSSESPPQSSYVASRNSDVFHYAWCRYVKRISAFNLLEFHSRSEAMSSGRRPCKVCKP